MADLTIGSTFAEHLIRGVAGHGGMGVVYRATHLRLKREVALKVIAPAVSGDAAFRARFEREFEAAASIDHPNVIPVYHAGEEDGLLFVTMRFVEGIDLRRLLAEEGRLEPDRATALIAQVAAALDAAHALGVVHRDVKPANILLDGDHALLTDFGLTKLLRSDRKVTKTGSVLGTFDYIAPEQFEGGHVDARTDVYGLGCVLYEALTGEVPYPRTGVAAKMFAHYSVEPPAVSALVPDVAREFDEVIARALAKDPVGRYQSAGDLARAALAAAAALPAELEAAARSPFVGRAEEFALLRDLWATVQRDGAGALAAIDGGPGMGKTRLAAELASEAHRDGAVVLYGTGERTLARVRSARGPTLLVVDDQPELCALLAGVQLAELPLLVVATAVDGRAKADVSLTLEPMDVEEVREIASLHAGPGEPDAVAVTSILAASGGVPRRVHELAREWSRRAAAERVDATAGRAASDRKQLRRIESELADSVIALQSVRERAALLTGDSELGESAATCPFQGLAAFDFDDAEYFFGRERMVAELVAQMVGSPLLAIVGSSGSGKSSLLRAGLLPTLAAGVLPGSDQWSRALMRPGEHPRAELERVLGHVELDRRFVLAVDQFEEVFTACANEDERRDFIAELVRVARDPGERAVVIIAIRGDFYARCTAYPELSRLMAANHVLVGSMSRDELRRAIERPAQRAGLSLEPELVDVLVDDVESEPGGLPLLSTALLQLWRQREGTWLRLSAYERTGGVSQAVARLAEDALAQLAPEQQALARRLLLRLAGPGPGAGDAAVRRRVPLAELNRAGGGLGQSVIARLADRRLLTVSAGEVEVAHEALLREWPRLREWIEADAEGRRLHRHLSFAAGEWDRRGRDASDLYRAGRLAAALDWSEEHDDELDANERAFLDASRAAGARAHRRLRAALAGVSAVLVLALGAGFVALAERRSAETEARISEAQRIGALALSERSLDRALLLARQGVALDDSLVTRGNLLAILARSPAAIGVMHGDAPLTALDLSPDERYLAVGDVRGTVLLFDVTTRRRVGTPSRGRGFLVLDLRFSPDGTRLAILDGIEVQLLDARTRRLIATLAIGGTTKTSSEDLPPSPPGVGLAFSPDSRVLFVAGQRPLGRAHVTRWDARTGQGLGAEVTPTQPPALVAMLAGGARLVMSGDELTTILDAGSLHPLERFRAAGVRAAVSRDERMIALATRAGDVRFLDLRTRTARTARGFDDADFLDVEFGANSGRLVSVGDDARLTVWAPQRAIATETLVGGGEAATVAVSKHGATAYTAERDGTITLWDIAGTRRLARPLDDSLVPLRSGPAVGDSVYVRRAGSGSLELADTTTFATTARIPVAGDIVSSAITPDARTLAVATARTRLELWDTRARRRLASPAGANWPIAFSRDGRRMAARGPSGSEVNVWDLDRQTTVGSPLLRGVPSEIALSPDATAVAAILKDGRNPVIASVGRRGRPRQLSVPGGHDLRFSRDGRWLLALDDSGRVWSFDTRTWEPRGTPLAGGSVTMDISPRGDIIATTGRDGSTRLWEVASGRPIGTSLPGLPRRPLATAFVNGGTRLLILYDSGGGYVWDLRESAWLRHACEVAGRTLTRAEWKAMLPRRPYDPTCR